MVQEHQCEFHMIHVATYVNKSGWCGSMEVVTLSDLRLSTVHLLQDCYERARLMVKLEWFGSH